MAISVGMLPRCNVVAAAANGPVNTLVVDPATGDVYFGGNFTTVNGQPRASLAAVTKNGKLKAWNPGVSGSFGTVSFMRWTSLGIFVVGPFFTLAGGSRGGAGLVDTTATLQAWDPQPSGFINQVDVDAAGVIFVGGSFTAIRGTARTNAAALTAANVLKSWQPAPNAEVVCLRVSGTLVYLGGNFTQVILASTGLAGTRNALACINGVNGLGTDGQATAFNATVALTAATAGVGCIDVDASGNIYFGAGGDSNGFDSVLGTARVNCASVTSTSTLRSWYPTGVPPPSTASGIYSVLIDGTNVYWSGFTTVTPFRQAGCMTTLAVDQAWHPEPNGSATPPFCLGSDGAGVIWMGGNFTNVLAINFTRTHLAKFKDATVVPTVLAW